MTPCNSLEAYDRLSRKQLPLAPFAVATQIDEIMNTGLMHCGLCMVSSSTGVARDVLHNVTYVLRDNWQIGIVQDGDYSLLFERSNVESLVVDWVANLLYWIEGGTTVSSEKCARTYANMYIVCLFTCVCALFSIMHGTYLYGGVGVMVSFACASYVHVCM